MNSVAVLMVKPQKYKLNFLKLNVSQKPCLGSLFLPALIPNLTGDSYAEDGLTKYQGPH